MQHVNPPKRPVGRPRKDALPPAQPHAPPSALNLHLSSITNSNETTNHFLGAGAVQRPWMRQDDAAPTTLPSHLHMRTASNQPSQRSTSTLPTSAAPSVPVVDGPRNVQSLQSNHAQLGSDHFMPSTTRIPTQSPVTIQDAHTEMQTTTLHENGTSGSQNVPLKGSTRFPGHVEIFDLTGTDQDISQPLQNATDPPFPNSSRLEPNPSHQSPAFADLPVLQVNDDFDFIMANGSDQDISLDASIPTQTVKDPSMSTSLVQVPELSLSRSNPPQLTVATASASIQVSNAISLAHRDLLLQPNSTHHPGVTHTRPPQLSPAASHTDNALHPTSVNSATLAQQPFKNPSLPWPSLTQLLTPQHSPLDHSTTLPQNRRPPPESSRHNRPVPPPHPSNTQQTTRYPLIKQPIVHSQPAFTSGSAPSTLRYSSISHSTDSLGNKGLSYLTILNTNVQDMSRRLDLNNRQWILRLSWLQDACQRSDLFFLHLNQLFCMWNMNPQTVRYLGMSKNCDAGFAVLELLFGKNTDLPRELLAFLAGWPNSTYSLEFNEEMKAWTTKMASFLPKFGANWSAFRQRCLQRKVPPMIAEIIHHLGCPFSTILPRAIFCSIQTQINPTCPQVLQNAVFHYFSSNVLDVQNNKPGCADFPNFKAGYQSIYARYSRTPGLSREQVLEIRDILIHYDSPTPFSRSSIADQAQYRISSPQVPLSVNAPSATATTTTDTAPGLPTNPVHSDHRQVSSGPPRTPTTDSPTIAKPMLASSASPVQQASPVLVQQQPQSLHSAMRPPNLPTPYAPSNVPSTTAVMTQPATTVPTLPLLVSGHVPVATERLLPKDISHLPDFLVNPDPVQESLHQVQFRQPLAELKVPLSGDQRLYQYIQGFALKPHAWLPSIGFIRLTFDVSDELSNRRSEAFEQPMGPFVIPKRAIGIDSVLFNLRCTKIGDRRSTNELEASWAALPTSWPQHIFISINNNHLEIRRKRHNRRDLPIDVTSFVVSGKNEVKISIHPEANERDLKHGIAVEVIGFCDHDRAVTLPEKIDAGKSLKSITSVMAPQQDSNDDDLVLVDDSMTISIADPFSSRVFTIPVRGRNCKHRECFDLETFLKSRQSDNKDALTSVYAWQCPICKGDARPCNLVLDEFFREVRDRVVERGQEEARAIIVRSDGTWEVKQDTEENGSANRSVSRQRSQGVDGDAATATESIHLDDEEAMNGTNDRQQSVSNTGSAPANCLPPPVSRTMEVIELD